MKYIKTIIAVIIAISIGSICIALILQVITRQENKTEEKELHFEPSKVERPNTSRKYNRMQNELEKEDSLNLIKA